MNKARVIYLAVLVCLLAFYLSASALPTSMFDGPR